MNRSDWETLIEYNRGVITKNDDFLSVYEEIIFVFDKNYNLEGILCKLNYINMCLFCYFS